MTPAHARYLAPGATVADFPAAALYEPGTVLCGEHGAHTFGPYRPGTFHPRNGFLAPSGNPRTLSLGPVNGPFLPRALEQLNYLVFVLDPERDT